MTSTASVSQERPPSDEVQQAANAARMAQAQQTKKLAAERKKMAEEAVMAALQKKLQAEEAVKRVAYAEMMELQP